MIIGELHIHEIEECIEKYLDLNFIVEYEVRVAQ